eukprot:Awhi_evm1s11294
MISTEKGEKGVFLPVTAPASQIQLLNMNSQNTFFIDDPSNEETLNEEPQARRSS